MSIKEVKSCASAHTKVESTKNHKLLSIVDFFPTLQILIYI